MQLAREAAIKAVEEKNVKNRANVQHMKELVIINYFIMILMSCIE